MEHKNNRVVKNAAWIIGIRIIQSVLSLIIGLFTTRYLGPSNYGLVSYAASFVTFVTPIMQLGLPDILVREIVENPDREGEVMGTSLVMSCISAVACMIGVICLTSVLNWGETGTIIICALYSIKLLASAIEMIQYWYQAKLASKYVSIVSLIAYIVVFAYKAFLLITAKSIYWFAVSNAIDYALIGIILIIIFRRISPSPLKFSFPLVGRLFSKSKYYIVSNMMVTVFAQTDRIMLKLMIDESAVGYYSAATTCAGLSAFVFTAIIDSMRPAILESKNKNTSAYEKNLSRLYCIVIYLSLLQSLVMTVFSPIIVNILYGSAYAPTASILQIIVWYTTFSYLGAVRNIWILAENQQKYLWTLNLSGAIANVVLNAVLIPFLGAVGAAIASLITQIFTNVILGYIVKPIRPNNKLMIKGCNLLLIKEMLMATNKNK